MNRASRRKLEQKGMKKESVMALYRKEAEDAGWKQGVRHSYKTILLLTAYIARMEFELDKNGLTKFMNRLLQCIESFLTGQLEPNDLIAIADECREYGFDIEKVS